MKGLSPVCLVSLTALTIKCVYVINNSWYGYTFDRVCMLIKTYPNVTIVCLDSIIEKVGFLKHIHCVTSKHG